VVTRPPHHSRPVPGFTSLKYSGILLLVVLYWMFTGFDILYSTGVFGTTKKNDGSGCICHGTGIPSTAVRVWVEGPASVLPGSTNTYRLLMTGGPAVGGGFNLAAGHGSLGAPDVMTQLLFGELTHTEPRPFTNDTVQWTFNYIAPPGTGSDTLFSVGNSVNGNFTPTEDEFNFGEPFTVAVSGDTVTAADDPGMPVSFMLLRNYPNPFNPSTKIRYTLPVAGEVDLGVYDVTGGRIATLVHARRGPGSYEADWDAAEQPAGVYFCRLTLEGESRALKMVLIR